MKTAQYKWTVVDDVMIGVGTDGKMPEDLWKNFINDLSTKPIKKWIAIVSGSLEVSSTQRKAGIDVLKARRMKMTAVVDSSITRGLITAASWFGVDIKSYPPDQLSEAVRALGVPENRIDTVVAAVGSLRKQMP
jgi:hypothetical protein